jgi:hypothetical protein
MDVPCSHAVIWGKNMPQASVGGTQAHRPDNGRPSA